MSPENNKNNNIGGTRGRAAFILRGDAARAAEAQVLLHAATMLGLTLLLSVMSAPDLWPRLFP